jgi:hypothetical protein
LQSIFEGLIRVQKMATRHGNLVQRSNNICYDCRNFLNKSNLSKEAITQCFILMRLRFSYTPQDESFKSHLGKTFTGFLSSQDSCGQGNKLASYLRAAAPHHDGLSSIAFSNGASFIPYPPVSPLVVCAVVSPRDCCFYKAELLIVCR